MLFYLDQLPDVRLDSCNLLFNVRHPSLRNRRRLPIGPVQIDQVALDTLLQVLHPHVDLVLREVLVPRVHGLELAPVDRDRRLREQTYPAAQFDELPANLPNGFAVVFAEVGDRLEIRHQAPREPDQLHVALRLPLQPAAGLDAVQVTVDVDLQ